MQYFPLEKWYVALYCLPYRKDSFRWSILFSFPHVLIISIVGVISTNSCSICTFFIRFFVRETHYRNWVCSCNPLIFDVNLVVKCLNSKCLLILFMMANFCRPPSLFFSTNLGLPLGMSSITNIRPRTNLQNEWFLSCAKRKFKYTAG